MGVLEICRSSILQGQTYVIRMINKFVPLNLTMPFIYLNMYALMLADYLSFGTRIFMRDHLAGILIIQLVFVILCFYFFKATIYRLWSILIFAGFFLIIQETIGDFNPF